MSIAQVFHWYYSTIFKIHFVFYIGNNGIFIEKFNQKLNIHSLIMTFNSFILNIIGFFQKKSLGLLILFKFTKSTLLILAFKWYVRWLFLYSITRKTYTFYLTNIRRLFIFVVKLSSTTYTLTVFQNLFTEDSNIKQKC